MKKANNKSIIKVKEQIVRNKFTIITFVCSVLVIYIHTFNLESYNITATSAGLIAKFTYYFQTFIASGLRAVVPLFFFISGILFFRTYEPEKLIQKYKSRVHTILIPYIIWCTLYYLYEYIMTKLPIISAYISNTKINLSIIEWLSRIIINEYYTLWFLKNLIVFIAITPILWYLLKEKKENRYYKLLIVVPLIIILEMINKPGNTLIDGLAYYIAGSYIGMNLKKYIEIKNKNMTKLSIIMILVTLPIITIFEIKNVLIYILIFICIWYSLDKINIKETELPWWMSITFYIYVAHDAILEAFEKIFIILFKTKPIFALLDYILMPILTLIIVIISAQIIKKFLPKTWKLITGGR